MEMSRDELALRFSIAAKRRLELRRFSIELSKLGDFIMSKRAVNLSDSQSDLNHDRPQRS